MFRKSISYTLLILFVFCSGMLRGQDPYHFVLGEEELSAIDVYSISQTNDQTYWIATNNGIYSYNGYAFTTYNHEAVLSNSFFNLISDYNGVIHFNNLNGQIFRVKEGKMELVHTVPDSLLSPYISYDFMTDNAMVIRAAVCYKVLENGGVERLFENQQGYNSLSHIMRDRNGDLLLQHTNELIYRITPQGISKIEVNYEDDQPGEASRNLKVVYQGNNALVVVDDSYLYDIVDSSANKITIRKVFEATESITTFRMLKNNFWIKNHRFGVRMAHYFKNETPLVEQSTLKFKDHFISTLFEDEVGNVLLGTFGDGIIVMPNTGMENIDTDGLKLSEICPNGKDGLIWGGFDGNVYAYENEIIEPIYTNGTKLVELLEYFPSEKLLLIDQKFPLLINLDTYASMRADLGSIKDVAQVHKNTYAIATNTTAVRANITKQGVTNKTVLYRGRTYAITYNPKHDEYIIGTSQGLMKLDTEQEQSAILYNNAPLMVNALDYDGGDVLLGTKQYGLLKLEKNGPVPFVNNTNGLLSNVIIAFKIKGNLMFVATEAGFQVFSRTGELIKSLSISDGLKTTKVKDFEVDDENLWLLHKDGLQKIGLDELLVQPDTYTSKMSTVKFYIDDKLQPQQDSYAFEAGNHKAQFEIVAPSLERQHDLSYRYRLHGIDNEWNNNKYHDHFIEYKSLPQGNYTFEVQLFYKEQLQDSYAIEFAIARHLWQQWWVVTLGLFMLVGAGYIYFDYRLKKQKKEAAFVNELNASKLTAIQSQMNPHFIFNALNSIQEYIVFNERKHATRYLGMFSDLMRIYLRQGSEKSITLTKEIEAIKLYLELEKMRFEDSMDYRIELDNNVHPDELSIPSLIIQPFVENALKHGLLHKSGNKQLVLSFSYDEEFDLLICKIEDNGIGRARSAEINKARNPLHQSFATGATQRRLELLNYKSYKPIGVEIIDLYDEQQQSRGTRVVLKIPTNYSVT